MNNSEGGSIKGDDNSSVASGGTGGDDINFSDEHTGVFKDGVKYQSNFDGFVFGIASFLSKDNIRSFHYGLFTIFAEFLRKLKFNSLLNLYLKKKTYL